MEGEGFFVVVRGTKPFLPKSVGDADSSRYAQPLNILLQESNLIIIPSILIAA